MRGKMMIAAHKAGRAYWRNNRPTAFVSTDLNYYDVAQVARSCGWGNAELLSAWMAGYFGERTWETYDVRTQTNEQVERHARGGRHRQHAWRRD